MISYSTDLSKIRKEKSYLSGHVLIGPIGSYMAIWSMSLTMCAEKDIMASAAVVVFNK